MLSELKSIDAAGAEARALSAVWTSPGAIFSALVIGWAAKAVQSLLSEVSALGVSARLQIVAEFAVETVIERDAGIDPEKVHLVTANVAGSLRLLVGLACGPFRRGVLQEKKTKGKELANVKPRQNVPWR